MSDSLMTFCISSFNNLNYLKLAVHSVRTYSHFKDAPFIIHLENNTDGSNEWLIENKDKYNLTPIIEPNNTILRGIGGGIDICAEQVKTEYIMFLHADFFVSSNWDLESLKMFDKYPNTPMCVSSYRIQPNIFHEESRPGTFVVDPSTFGEYYHNFNEEYFIEYAKEFTTSNDIEIRKGEGVSFLVRKSDWDNIGGSDPLFSPAYFEDFDYFIRMQLLGYKFVLTTKSVVYHFASRASRFPDDDLTQRKSHLADYEKIGFQKWIKKWGKPPEFDEIGFIKPIYGTNNPLKILK